MTIIFAQIGMFAWLPVALPVMLAAVAGAGAAFGVNRLISAATRRHDRKQ